MIELQHIAVSYGKRDILRDINACIAPERITAVMGPNGCGKTTMLRCIGGLLEPTAGAVTLDGKLDKDDLSSPERLQAYQAQMKQLYGLEKFAFILMGRNPYQRRLQNESQEDWDIVERCMRQTGTWELRFAKPAQMSGGELQRVMIARALAQQTPVLLMDEPVSNLDIAHQIEIMRLLRAATDKTVLIVLHDLNLALRFCDEVILLHEGALLYQGPVAEGLTPERIATVYGVASHRTDGQVVLEY